MSCLMSPSTPATQTRRARTPLPAGKHKYVEPFLLWLPFQVFLSSFCFLSLPPSRSPLTLSFYLSLSISLSLHISFSLYLSLSPSLYLSLYLSFSPSPIIPSVPHLHHQDPELTFLVVVQQIHPICFHGAIVCTHEERHCGPRQ